MIPEVNERCTNIKIGKNEFFSVPRRYLSSLILSSGNVALEVEGGFAVPFYLLATILI